MISRPSPDDLKPLHLLLASRRGIIRQRYQHLGDVGKRTGAIEPRSIRNNPENPSRIYV